MIRALAFEPDADGGGHRASVDLGADDLAGAAYLHVHGIATVWQLAVNGTVVLSDTSMFARHQAEVAAHLRVGANQIEVRCLPLEPTLDAAPRRPRQRWRTRLVDDARLRWLRTTVLGRAPGFAPGPPVEGPWRPVLLETAAPVRVTSLSLRPSVAGTTGVLEVEAVVEGADVVTLEVGDVGSELVIVGGVGRARVEIPDVALWWPHTHGTPACHSVALRHDGELLDLPGDGTTGSTSRTVGFRGLENRSSTGSLDLRVNDVPVFVRGAVWTPGDLGALDAAVELGLNLVRVPGTAAYETDEFHARCDELGLLVWQDLMFVTLDYPLADEGFAGIVREEVAGESARLVGHPSVVVVCGSAEHEQQAAMFGVRLDTTYAGELAALLAPVVAASGLDAIWVDSTPTGGLPPTRVDTGVAQYFGVGAYLRPLADARTAGVHFAAECLAFANPPADDEGGDPPRDNGADWDFADVREHYLRERYGPAPTEEERGRVSGEVMADVFAEWRRADSPCGGGIVLWLRDLLPGPGWGLLDHRGRPKPCAAALAPVLQPLAVWLVDEGLNGVDVHVANDGPDPVRGELRVALLRADGSEVDSATREVRLDPHRQARYGADELLGRFADSADAYRFGPPAHVSVRAELCSTAGDRRAILSVAVRGPSTVE